MAGTTWPAVRRSHAADLVVAVDCSTTASKALIFDAGGRTLGQGRHAIPLAQPGPGRHEQSASDWWTATSSAVRTALAGLYPARVAAVVVTHQRETFCCLVDESEVRPAIVWMDSRAQRLVQTLGSEEVHAVSGRPPDNTPPLYKLAWLTRHEPLMIDRATRIGDVGAYLNLRLTGRWVSSWASADCLGLMDMLSRTWSEDLCALAGVRAEQLPGIVAPGEVIGGLGERAARELGLPPGTAVIAGAGDGQCAAVGAGAIAPGVLYLNMGTAIASGTTSPNYAWSKNHRTVAAASGTGFLYEAFLSSGTYMVNWFCREFGPFTAPGLDLTSEALLEAAASRVPRGADGLLALPYWNAAQTPYWDASARGAVVGWTGYHGKAHLYRAILEGIALEIRLQTEGVTAAVSPSPTRLIVTGGGSRSRLWMQVLADVLDRPLEISAEPETTALGAAMLGAVAAGLHLDLGSAVSGMSRSSEVLFEPDPAGADVYAQLWTVYRGLYAALQPSLSALSELAQDSSSRTAVPS